MMLNIMYNVQPLLPNRGPSYSARILVTGITVCKTKPNKPTFLQLVIENMSNQLPEMCTLDERIAIV